MTRIVFVHGSVANAELTWGRQRALGDRYELVLLTRSGYPPREELERIDFEDQADEIAAQLQTGDHLVGHSYGGVVSLLAASRVPALGSLTVGEPPAFGVARGDPAVEDFLSRFEEFALSGEHTPEEYLSFFLPFVGARMPPGRPSETILAGARAALAERWPHEALIPLDALRDASYPKLVISGAHNAALDAVCDVLERELPAERAVLRGAGHSLPGATGYNDVLADFVDRASS